MDPLLQLLDRGLQGDADALTLLERTASIYIFDGTHPRIPKTYGIWDFINQTLTEIERYESRLALSTSYPTSCSVLNNHVQLLANISRRAARRTSMADRKLIQVCLENAAQYYGSPEQVRSLIDANSDMRQRVMGRIAAIVFDYSYHIIQPGLRGGVHPPPSSFGKSNATYFISAFSHPNAMESLCALVASNAIATSPSEVQNLVIEIIVPALKIQMEEEEEERHYRLSMPPFSVAAVIYYIAHEAMSKSAPAGTRDLLKHGLFATVISKVLAPILVESVRESDTDMIRDDNASTLKRNHSTTPSNSVQLISSSYRIASMAIQALEVWMSTTGANITQMVKVCEDVKVNLIAAISDSIYSDSVNVLDAVSDLLQVLFSQKSKVVSTQQLQMFNDDLQYRNEVLTELISAVNLQKTRFAEAERREQIGVCHALARIAATVTIALQPLLTSGKLHVERCSGMVELLMQASMHTSIHVCAIALEAFPSLIKYNLSLALQLLRILQGRAIMPPSLVGFSSTTDICDADLQEFESFRENILSDVLTSCYIVSRSYYVESCVSAVEEFCDGYFPSSPNCHLPFQLEAALFCLSAVAVEASKRALLHGTSPAAHLVVAKACSDMKRLDGTTVEIESDAKMHDEQLMRCVRILAKSPSLAFSNDFALRQMCRFIGKYAQWISKCSTDSILDDAASLAMKAFNRTVHLQEGSSESLSGFSISPFTDAATALQNILSRSPQRFASPEALTVLEAGWKEAYDKCNSGSDIIGIEERKAFCSGICRVLAALPPKEWCVSLTTLSDPTIVWIENAIKQNRSLSTEDTTSSSKIVRLAEEIQILSNIIRVFSDATSINDITKTDSALRGHVFNPVHSILQRIWQSLQYIAEEYSWDGYITTSLCELLSEIVSIEDDNYTTTTLKLMELKDIAIIILNKAGDELDSQAIVSLLDFIAKAIDTFGHRADQELLNSHTVGTNENIRGVIESLIYTGVIVSKKSLPQDNAPEILSRLFTMFSTCARRCPLVVLQLPLAAGDQGREGQLLAQIIERALTAINEKESDVARQAMFLLKELILPCVTTTTEEDSARNKAIRSNLEPLIVDIREELTQNLLQGACGVFPQDVLDPAASLYFTLLHCSFDMEGNRTSIMKALHWDGFILGEEARNVALKCLLRCAQETASSSTLLMDLFSDLWYMHQCEDKDGSAGSDDVVVFIHKYS